MPKKRASIAQRVRDRVERGGARLWKHADFQDLPPGAVAQALSRLSREGVLERVAKGVYYHPTPTIFGPSIASATAVAAGTINSPVFPAGLTAANVLGLSSQNPYTTELATSTTATPTALQEFVVHVDRPEARKELSSEEGAILEVLRGRATSSDLPPDQTAERLMRLLSSQDRFERVARASLAEPPRVRAMVGALGQELGMSPRSLRRLRKSLNPLSRYDFGPLRVLRYAREWQAK